jgi:hypothetical protein
MLISRCGVRYSTGKLSGNKIDMLPLFKKFVNEKRHYGVVVFNEIVYKFIQTEVEVFIGCGIKDFSMKKVLIISGEDYNQVTNILFQYKEFIFRFENSCIVTSSERYLIMDTL